MSEQVKSEEGAVIDMQPVKRPTQEMLDAATPEIASYLDYLEKKVELHEEHIEALVREEGKSPEALGISWCDFVGYKLIDMPNGEQMQFRVQFNNTQRSMVGMRHAFETAWNDARYIVGEYQMRPWSQEYRLGIHVQTNGGKPKQDQPEGRQSPPPENELPAQDQPSRGRRAPTGTQTAEPDAIGGEKWYKVQAMEIALTKAKEPFVQVKVGRWKKHGLAAYLDSSNMPEDVVASIKDGEWTERHQPVAGDFLVQNYADMQWALVAADESKIVGFSDSKPA